MSKRVQSVLFPRDKFTKRQADAWLIKHRYKHIKYHLTKDHRRYRQFTPVKSGHYRNIRLSNGVILVMMY